MKEKWRCHDAKGTSECTPPRKARKLCRHSLYTVEEGLPTGSCYERKKMINIAKDFENEISKQRELDRARLDSEWQNLVTEAGGGERGEAIASAMKQLYSLYTPALTDWFSRIYDSETGGFYATVSGHDTEGFGPDVEATMQTLTFIKQCGMLRDVGTLEEALPEWQKKKLLRFAKNLQHPNGYFYHPQWSFDDVHSSISRRGRDLGWATTILTTCGSSPTYDTPSGRKGDGLDADGNPIEKPSFAQSEDKPKSNIAIPEFLLDKDSFLRYLSGFDMKNNSYRYGNMLNSTVGQIRARSNALMEEGADYSLVDILINWLNERIDPKTGYWSSRVDLEGSNGFFKTMAVYNALGAVYPYPEEATLSVLHNIMGDEIDSGNCCSLFNLWSGITFIKKNVAKNPDEALRARVLHTIDETLRDKGAEAILNTYRKFIPYRRADGSFSHSYVGCGGAQQGLITGLTPMYGVDEGCVDATCICTTGLTRTLFEAFGFTRVSLLTKADWLRFIYNLENTEKTVKTRSQNPYLTFPGDELPKTVVPSGDGVAYTADGKLNICLGEDRNVYLFPTARTCKGDIFLFEADIEFSHISKGGGVRLAIRPNAIKTILYLDVLERDGELFIENTKWQVGFTARLPKKCRLRLEIYLDESPRLDGWKRKCSAVRVYADGKYLGKVINNDGRDPDFPSFSGMNVIQRADLLPIGDTEAEIKLESLRFYYAWDERSLG